VFTVINLILCGMKVTTLVMDRWTTHGNPIFDTFELH